MKDIHIKDNEYKKIFIETMVKKAKIQPSEIWIAYTEFDAHLESMGDDFIGDPKIEAEECMSCWSE